MVACYKVFLGGLFFTFLGLFWGGLVCCCFGCGWMAGMILVV